MSGIRVNNLIILLALLTLCSCGKKELEPKAYIAWVENESNGLKISKKLGEYNFTLQYQPSDYFNAKHGISEEVKSEKDSMQYYTMRIFSEGKGDVLRYGVSDQEYQDRIQYFSYEFSKDITLIDGKDTLPCILYHFERSYDMAPFNTLVLGFEDRQSKQDKVFSFDDKVLGTGKINLIIQSEDIQRIPLLKHSNEK
jgi:hypothetical protein